MRYSLMFLACLSCQTPTVADKTFPVVWKKPDHGCQFLKKIDEVDVARIETNDAVRNKYVEHAKKIGGNLILLEDTVMRPTVPATLDIYECRQVEKADRLGS